MRSVRIIAAIMVVATLAATGCTAHRPAGNAAAPASSGSSSVTTTQPTAGSTGTTTTTLASPATASCAVAPDRGPADSRVNMTCSGFAPSERVDVRFGAVVLTTARATTGGDVAASFAVPSGFAGSHYPGRKDTFQAKGRQSGRAASATFTVTG
jgi:hypothetical protein